jgi:hypothetical protein
MKPLIPTMSALFTVSVSSFNPAFAGSGSFPKAEISYMHLDSTKDFVEFKITDRKASHCKNSEKNCRISGIFKFPGNGVLHLFLNTKKSKVVIKCNSKVEYPFPGPVDKKMALAGICAGNQNPHIGEDLKTFRRGGGDDTLPYIVSPRYSMIRNKQPILRWNAVAGATNYTVHLVHDRSPDPICTIQNVVGTPKNNIIEVSFEHCKNSDLQSYQLQLGHYYKLEVIAYNSGNKINSTQETMDRSEYRAEDRGVEESEFRLIDPNEEQEISKLLEEIRKDAMSEEESIIRTSSMYASYNLYSEAILSLEKLIEINSSSPALYLRLGDYYASSGLLRLANLSYCKANSLVELQGEDQKIYEKELENRWKEMNQFNLGIDCKEK